MTGTSQKKLEDIADDLMDSFLVFSRRISRDGAHPGAKKFDPSRAVLRVVLQHGPMRMSDISRHMGISKPYMTVLVNKLIREGLVERVSNPEDRRVVNVRITEAGREGIREFTKRVRETVIRNLASLDTEDISLLHESTKEIRSIISKLDRDETRKCKLG